MSLTSLRNVVRVLGGFRLLQIVLTECSLLVQNQLLLHLYRFRLSEDPINVDEPIPFVNRRITFASLHFGKKLCITAELIQSVLIHFLIIHEI